MKKYEITEDQIKDLASGKAKSKLKTMFPEVFAEKLEIGWITLKCDAGSILIYVNDFNTANNNYGFSRDGMYFINENRGWSYTYKQERWRKATYEEVKEALEKECINRFGEDWENAKIEKSLTSQVPKCRNYGILPETIDIEQNEIWNKNGCIFKDGIWAEPLKEVELTMQEIADKFEVKVENLKIKK